MVFRVTGSSEENLSEFGTFSRVKAKQLEAKNAALAVEKIETLLSKSESNEFAKALREARVLKDFEFEMGLRNMFLEVEFHVDTLINKHPAFMQVMNKAWLEYKIVRLMNPDMKAEEARRLFKLIRR